MDFKWDEIRKRTLAVFSGPHWVHERFASVVAESSMVVPSRASKRQSAPSKALNLLRSASSIPGGYDIYFCEACYYYPAIAKRLHRINGKIINLCGSPLFYNIWKGIMGKAESRVLLELFKSVDGMVLEGNYTKEALSALHLRVPTVTSYTYIKPGRYEALAGMKADLGTKNIAITATNDIEYKGVDLLLKAMPLINEQDPAIKLRIIHRNLDMDKIRHLLTPNVGLEEDVEKAFRTTSLYVHPSRGDVFPIAPLEAMLAGIPTMVSTDTGTKEFVEKVDKKHVLPLEPEAIAGAVLNYFSSTEKQRRGLSAEFREQALQFNEKEQLGRLEREYKELLRSI
ncbi:MAG: glycosyltransferase [Candidatus ainarchaeum sp.]|nr:glycosyltransferase [Candidatus ainarchaeum sp.]MDD5096754.1 glycosyltransferase [Candidatus ainarchaeum sp.]